MSYVPWGDHHGCRLELSHLPSCDGPCTAPAATAPRPGEGCLNIRITGPDFDLPVHKLAEFTATLYEAAGRPAPAVLDLPRLDGAESRHLWGTTFSVSHYPGNVRFGADGPGGHMLNMRPGDVGALAGILMAHANAAAGEDKPEPDAADLWALGRILERAGVSEYHSAALAALRAGYTPPGRQTP
jgi:hypothetical protein